MLNQSIKIKHIIFVIILFAIGWYLANSYTSKKYLQKENQTLKTQIDSITNINTELHTNIETNNIKLKATDSLIKISEQNYKRVIWSLSELKKQYKNEKTNPTHTTTNDRTNFIRSKIGK